MSDLTKMTPHKRKRTHTEFVEIVHSKLPSIQIIGEYLGATERIQVKCKECGREWSPKAYSLTTGRGCLHCGRVNGAKKGTGCTRTRTHEEFINELSNILPDIVILDQYVSNKTYVSCLCNRCNHNWKAKPQPLLSGHGCPRCAKSGTSFTEQLILACFRKVLGEDTVLSRDRSAIGMELDILIPSYCIAFEPGSWNLHQKALERDRRKRELCFEKGIRLITIYESFNERIKPFENDCYVYSVDFNAADHTIIRDMIGELFALINVKIDFSDEEWEQLETVAYSNSKSRTHDEFVEELKGMHPNIRVIGKYINSNHRLEVNCLKCGFTWNAVPANMLAGDGCRKCGRIKVAEQCRKSQYDFVEQVKVKNPYVEIVGEYTNRHAPVRSKCLLCGEEWEPVAASLLRGSIHKQCSNKVVAQKNSLTQEEFEKRISVVNPSIEIIGKYESRHKPVKAKCKICGHVWEPIASSILNGYSHTGSRTIHKNYKKT